jgi:hypothetical protein
MECLKEKSASALGRRGSSGAGVGGILPASDALSDRLRRRGKCSEVAGGGSATWRRKQAREKGARLKVVETYAPSWECRRPRGCRTSQGD